MPKTFWQSVVFTFITATLMVLIMSSYNMLLRTNGQLWFVGWNNFLAELSCALPLALLIAGRYAPTLAHKLLDDKVSYCYGYYHYILYCRHYGTKYEFVRFSSQGRN